MKSKSRDKSVPSAQKVLVAGDLLAELDEEAERYLAAAKLSRVQMVAVALREWLDMRQRLQQEKQTE